MIERLKQIFSQWSHLFGIMKNAGWLTIERVLRLGGAFFIGIWVTVSFEPEEYAVFAYGLTFVVIARSITGLGLRSIFVRQYVADPERRLRYAGTSLVLIAMAGLAGYLLAVIISLLLGGAGDGSTLIVAILAGQLLLYPTEVINYVFEARLQNKYTVIARMIGYGVSLGLKIAIVLMGGSIVHLALTYLADWTVVAGLYLLAARKQKLKLTSWKWDKEVARSLLGDSIFLILSGVMVTLYMQIDQPMLYKWAGKEESGLYSFAVQLAVAFNFIPIVVQQSVFPNIVASGRRNEQEFLSKMVKLVRILFYSSIVICLGVTLFSDLVLHYFPDFKYAGSWPMLKIVIWALPMVSLGLVQGVYLVSKNLVMYSLYLTSIGAVANIALNLCLMPAYGGIGAAVATVISYSCSGIWAGLIFPATRPYTILVLRSIFFLKGKSTPSD